MKNIHSIWHLVASLFLRIVIYRSMTENIFIWQESFKTNNWIREKRLSAKFLHLRRPNLTSKSSFSIFVTHYRLDMEEFCFVVLSWAQETVQKYSFCISYQVFFCFLWFFIHFNWIQTWYINQIDFIFIDIEKWGEISLTSLWRGAFDVENETL